MNYYIRKMEPENNNAGSKAPGDICRICQKMGWQEIKMPSPDNNGKISSRVWQLTTLPKVWRSICRQLRPGDALLYQHPLYYGTKIAYPYLKKLKEKKVRLVVLIHDMESLRNSLLSDNSAEGKAWEDGTFLSIFDKIICHNTHMKDYLASKGFPKEKLIPLGIFDYLCPEPQVCSDASAKPEQSVAIAGNLDPAKCSYIYQAAKANPDLRFRLYGGNYTEKEPVSNITYMGSYAPEKIPEMLSGSFGLVWDGPDLDIRPGTIGDYLRYNNPHKCSLYLASGLPVMIWKEAALADFVESGHLGITVSDLTDLSAAVKKITEAEYLEIKNHVMLEGEKIRSGYYFSRAIHTALSDF